MADSVSFFSNTDTFLCEERSSVAQDFLRMIGYEYYNDLSRKDTPINLFGVSPYSAEFNIFMMNLFVRLVKKSDWQKKYKDLWVKKFVMGKAIDDIARDYNQDPNWVLEQFCKSHNNLSLQVREWWKKQLKNNTEEDLHRLMQDHIDEICQRVSYY